MRRFRQEHLLYSLAFILALAVRVIKLGSPPLTDIEARWALQALSVARGTQPILGSEPAYILLTSVLFYGLGAGTTFLARLVPALAGSSLSLVPALFEQRLKPRVSVILAFLLAVDPGLVALSRQAGSNILAVCFLLLAWGFWEKRRAAWAGLFAGLALLSGSLLWPGLLGLAVTWLITRAFDARRKAPQEATDAAPVVASPAPFDWQTALWFGLGTVVVGGTLFFLAPNGLSAWLSSLPDYISGWTRFSGLPAGLMLFSLIAYQPLGLIFAVAVALRGWTQGSKRIMTLSLWLLVSLLLAMFYPGRQIGDLAWALIPLWALAALELARSLNVLPEERREVLGVVALTVLILVFIWINFLGLLKESGAAPEGTLRVWLLLGSFFLLFISLMLVAVGWSLRAARFGAIWGLAIALGIYSFGVMVGAAGLRAVPDAVELWQPGSSMPEADLLQLTVDQISDWSDTNINAQPVTIAGIDSPALQWLLRGHAVTVVPALDPSGQPPIVITTEQDNPLLAANYRGQDFVWQQQPMWNQTTISDWIVWLGFHRAPESPQKVIVWVRSDLFIDSTTPKP